MKISTSKQIICIILNVVSEVLNIMPADPEKDVPPANYEKLLPKEEAPAAAAVGGVAILFVCGLMFWLVALDVGNIKSSIVLLYNNVAFIFHRFF